MGGRVPALDGLRGVAILLVLGYHAGALPAGHLGVSVFFVLSGYLITALLLSEVGRNGSIDRRAFYLRRVARLGPALILVLAVHAFLFSGDGAAAVAWGVLPALLYAMSFTRPLWQPALGTGWAWSLSIEEQFYAVWPWLLARPRRLFAACVVAVVAVACLRAAAAFTLGWEAAYFSTLTRADGLLLGALVALARPALPAWSAWAGVTLLALAVGFGSPHGVWTLALAVPAVQVGVALMICRHDALGWLRWAPLIHAGTISYGLYLWSALVYNVIIRTGAEHLALWLVGASLVLAELSWVLFERPIQRWSRHRLEVRHREDGAAVARAGRAGVVAVE